MGIFNLIAGGYYGKVGGTIGQRWRNIRTVRAYTKPTDPRTVKQQDNRRAFADASRAVQLALQLNAGAPFWKGLNQTEQNRRMSTARTLAKNAEIFSELIPLLPLGALPGHTFASAPTLENGVLTWYSTDSADLAGVHVRLMLNLRNTVTNNDTVEIIERVITGESGNWSVTYALPAGLQTSETSWQLGVSADTATELADLVYFAPLSLANLKTPVSVTADEVQISWDSTNEVYTGVLTLSEPVEQSALPAFSAQVVGILVGDDVTQKITVSGVTADGALSFTFEPITDRLGQRVLFPSGSLFTFGFARFESANYSYALAGEVLSFSAPTVTQNWAVADYTPVKNEDGSFEFEIPGATLPDGTVSLTANVSSRDSGGAVGSVTVDWTAYDDAGRVVIYAEAITSELYWLNTTQKAPFVEQFVIIKNGVSYRFGSATEIIYPPSVHPYYIGKSTAEVVGGSGQQLRFRWTPDEAVPPNYPTQAFTGTLLDSLESGANEYRITGTTEVKNGLCVAVVELPAGLTYAALVAKEEGSIFIETAELQIGSWSYAVAFSFDTMFPDSN